LEFKGIIISFIQKGEDEMTKFKRSILPCIIILGIAANVMASPDYAPLDNIPITLKASLGNPFFATITLSISVEVGIAMKIGIVLGRPH
jgi:hypothetical protein